MLINGHLYTVHESITDDMKNIFQLDPTSQTVFVLYLAAGEDDHNILFYTLNSSVYIFMYL